MTNQNSPKYVATLKAKQGEAIGINMLSPDVMDKLKILFELPRVHAFNQDEFKGTSLKDVSEDEIVYKIGKYISSIWTGRPCFLKTSHLIKDLGSDKISTWLPRLFNVARAHGALPIPVANINQLLDEGFLAYKNCIDKTQSQHFSLIISYEEITNDLPDKIHEILSKLDVAPEKCAILLDFSTADITNIEIARKVVKNSFEKIYEIAKWQEIVFLAGSYPSKNPEPGKARLDIRNEWSLWKSCIEEEGIPANHLIFGDYVAENSNFKFPKNTGGGAPAHHMYRYCTPNAWYTVREDEGNFDKSMKKVAREIISSPYYAGKDFSEADAIIDETANGILGPGNATKWRAINTCHHITQVVHDLGKIYNYKINNINNVSDEDKQMDLLGLISDI